MMRKGKGKRKSGRERRALYLKAVPEVGLQPPNHQFQRTCHKRKKKVVFFSLVLSTLAFAEVCLLKQVDRTMRTRLKIEIETLPNGQNGYPQLIMLS